MRFNQLLETLIITILFSTSLLAFFSPIYISKSFVDWTFILYLILIGNNIYMCRRLTLFQMWNVAYVYVIVSEMILISHRSIITQEYQFAISFLLLANAIFVIGYEIARFHEAEWNIKHSYLLKHKKWFVVIILSFILFFIYYKFGRAITNFYSGRKVGNALGNGSVMRIVVNAIGMVTPTLIGYYFVYHTKNKWISLLFVMPLLIIQFMISTRFRVLYMILPYLIIMNIVPYKFDKFRKLLLMFLLFIVFSVGSSYLKKYRYTTSLEDLDFSVLYERSSNPFVSIANKMSPEGIVHMTVLANDYFKVHSLSHGREISYFAYFWVPRRLWEDKPTPIDYWLIREYETIGESVTTASGFTGEIRADFGYYCLIIVFLWGIALKYLDMFVLVKSRKDKSYDKVITALFFPWIFFFVRSPNTATIPFLLEIILLMLIRKCLFSKKETQLPANKKMIKGN